MCSSLTGPWPENKWVCETCRPEQPGYDKSVHEDNESVSSDESDCEFCDMPDFKCRYRKEGIWYDCRHIMCSPPNGNELEWQYKSADDEEDTPAPLTKQCVDNDWDKKSYKCPECEKMVRYDMTDGGSGLCGQCYQCGDCGCKCSDDEEDENKCERCGDESDGVFVHPFGCIGLCEKCTDEYPQCPKGYEDGGCDVCEDLWRERDYIHSTEEEEKPGGL